MPTIKQQLAFQRVLKGEPISKAMREVGFSAKTKTDVLTRTKGWQQLVEQHLPDEQLLKIHSEGLKATHKGKPDYNARFKYLETAYKLKQRFADSPSGHGDISINIFTAEQFQRIARRIIDTNTVSSTESDKLSLEQKKTYN